jgi:hypothetical protein
VPARPPLTKDEEYTLESVASLAKNGLPIVPMSVAVRTGFTIDKASLMLESLRAKRYLGDM